AAQFEKVRNYIKLGLEEGARMIVGEVPTDMTHGYYVKPVVFSDVNNQMRIAREEIFGPVLCVIPYDDEAEALKIANDTPYGLSAC
ncbi:aldehyde dehydrogenase family protein, partial [Escherichia coli]|uniref:aldehyde dehydrogenase family protein n=1 Tax=Escherichia coli TaxID=562 RepID=UPI002739915B